MQVASSDCGGSSLSVMVDVMIKDKNCQSPRPTPHNAKIKESG